MRRSTFEIEPAARNKFRTALLRWYDGGRRDLPWRRTKDAYEIWISEIMLQQTRVAAVLERYSQFLSRFPNVRALAGATEDEVLAVWSGLGYYRRARSLRVAAEKIVLEMGGEFPSCAEELRRLPGVGQYTANAVASIAFGERLPVVDGNVARVIGRLGAASVSDREAWQVAGDLLHPDRPGDFNQAMMELGAVICTPAKPKCADCPVYGLCKTRGIGDPRSKLKPASKIEVDFVLALRPGKVYLCRRSKRESLMPGMWELPKGGEGTPTIAHLKHSITNSSYTVRVHRAEAVPRGGRWRRVSSIREMALTGLARKILRLLVIDENIQAGGVIA